MGRNASNNLAMKAKSVVAITLNSANDLRNIYGKNVTQTHVIGNKIDYRMLANLS
jgi:hypothetical protein